MKKTILFIVFAAMLAGSLRAQDTVWMKTMPLSNYFNGNWFDTNDRYTGGIASIPRTHVVARQFVTKDTLQVYGIAAMVIDEFWGHFNGDLQAYLNIHYPNFPSYENCEEDLMLYQHDGTDPMLLRQLGDTLSVHILYTPVSYYLMTHTPTLNRIDTIAKPVYERYFAEPQTVHDTFYTGITHHEFQLSVADSEWHQATPTFGGVSICHPDCSYFDESIAYLFQDSLHKPCEWRFRNHYENFRRFIFPILTPPDTTIAPGDTISPGDTIVNPADPDVTTGSVVLRPGNTLVVAPGDTLVIRGDTLVNTGDTLVIALGDTVVVSGIPIVVNVGDTLFAGAGDTFYVNPDGSIAVSTGGTVWVNPGPGPGVGLRQADLIHRYTAVSPNPATQRATVTSSFGLLRIEAYDSQGRRIHEAPASGYRADLNVSSWPRGACLLRITTPLGTATKKLLLQ